MNQTAIDFTPRSMIHAANIDKSKRLQKFIGFLGTGEWRTTREIIEATGICAVSAVASEVRANQIAVDCKCVKRGVYAYRLPSRAHLVTA